MAGEPGNDHVHPAPGELEIILMHNQLRLHFATEDIEPTEKKI